MLLLAEVGVIVAVKLVSAKTFVELVTVLVVEPVTT
jgi:hypothetical protein